MTFTRKFFDHLSKPSRFVDFDAHPGLVALTVATLAAGPGVLAAAGAVVGTIMAAEGAVKLTKGAGRLTAKTGKWLKPKPKPYIPPTPAPVPTKSEREAAAWKIYNDNVAMLSKLPDSPQKSALLDGELQKLNDELAFASNIP